MRVALTVWEGRISPVFDVSREAVIVTLEAGRETDRRTERIEAPTDELKVSRLEQLEVDTLVCGAISENLRQALIGRGIEVLGFVAGTLEEVLEALEAGTLPGPALAMPGCGGRQFRMRGRQGQGRGQGQGQGQGQGRGRGRGRGDR
jgi:predicted Fe-Mo cluster-binding NifX family protein